MQQIDLFPLSKKVRILSFGGGVDSSAILELQLQGEHDFKIDHVVFSDTGAEREETYSNVNRYKKRCEDVGIKFSIVSREGENITEWVTRLGILPLMPGGSHVCSLKFKGEVIKKFVNSNYPDSEVTYLIGIEANEERRTKRFTKPKGDNSNYEYPLQELNLDRDACLSILSKYGSKVFKSSCVFCPFMSIEEIKEIRELPIEWAKVNLVEDAFKNTSPIKHQAWIDAGKPLNKGGRCNRGHWRKDSWYEGARLFAKKVNGKQLSVKEWAEYNG